MSRKYNYDEGTDEVIDDVAYEWEQAHETIEILECTEDADAQCVEYPPFHSAITWFPESPYDIEGFDLLNWPPFLIIGVTISGWLSDLLSAITAFLGLGDLIEQLSGYQDGDVITTIANFESGFGIGGNLSEIAAPGFRFDWNGAGTVELHLLEVVAGGVAFIGLDQDPFAGGNFIGDLIEIIDTILDPDDLILDLERNLLSVPLEVGESSRIIELTAEEPGDHFVSVRFLPNLAAEATIIGFGGGLRKIVLCTADVPAPGEEEMFDIRVTANCGLEKSTDGGVTWIPIAGSENLLACQAAAYPPSVNDVSIDANDNINYTKAGSPNVVTPRIMPQLNSDPSDRIWGDSAGALQVDTDHTTLAEFVRRGFAGAYGFKYPNAQMPGALILTDEYGNSYIDHRGMTDDQVSQLRIRHFATSAGTNLASDFNSWYQLRLYDHLGSTPVIQARRLTGVPRLGFFGSSAITKPIVSGSYPADSALSSLIQALDALGLIDASPASPDYLTQSEILTDVTFADCLMTVWRNHEFWRDFSIEDCVLSAAHQWDDHWDFTQASDQLIWTINEGQWTLTPPGLKGTETGTGIILGEMEIELSFPVAFKLVSADFLFSVEEISDTNITAGIQFNSPADAGATGVSGFTEFANNNIHFDTDDEPFLEVDYIKINISYDYDSGQQNNPLIRLIRLDIAGVSDQPDHDPT